MFSTFVKVMKMMEGDVGFYRRNLSTLITDGHTTFNYNIYFPRIDNITTVSIHINHVIFRGSLVFT